MDAKEQADGEKRVMTLVFTQLEDLGLGRPTTTTKAGYEKMKQTVCQCLAGVEAAALAELCDWAQAHPGGPNKDRVPIGLKLLERAREISPPDTKAAPSPLMQSIFRADLGRRAIREGWSVELLKWVRARPAGERKWPGGYTQDQIKQQAYEPRRRLGDIELRLSEGRAVSDDEAAFRDRRLAALRECEDIAAQGVEA